LLLTALLAALASQAWPAVADAATRRGTDPQARVRFTLDGRLLTVRVLRSAPARTLRALSGRRIQASCGTNFAFTRKVSRIRRWPRGRRRVRYRFARNISRRAVWCLLEYRRGGDIAFASVR
jgi:hypothetical protein